MDNSTSINLLDLPNNPFEAREFLLGKTGVQTLAESTKYINERYNDRDTLKCIIDFSSISLLFAAPSSVDTLNRIGFFPWTESRDEIGKALNLIMLGFYKNSYDSMRRALELIIVAAYFSLDFVCTKEAQSWANSVSDTPKFSKLLKNLATKDPFQGCDKQCEFKDYVSNIFHKLSDFMHTKDLKNSNHTLANLSEMNGVRFLSFNEVSCKKSLDLFIETSRTICLFCVLINPPLLIGFDLERKFGINEPASGFFTQPQAERIYRLVPDHFKPFIDELRVSDEVCSIEKWFNDLPDISDDEFEQKIKEMNSLLNIED